MFAVIGEALIDVVCRAGADPVEHVGGSPANVAFGLARLRAPVQLISSVGDDARGARIRQALSDAGIDPGGMRTDAGPTSTATARIDENGSASYEFDLRWNPGSIEVPAGARVVHTGSLATVAEPGASSVLSSLRTIGSSHLISFDPNCRPAILGPVGPARAGIEEIVRLSHLVKGSDEDLAWLYPDDSAEDVMSHWLQLGARLVVVTRGAGGAVAVGRGGRAVQGAPTVDPVDLVDAVGAGDSFTAAMLHALALAGSTTPDAVAELTEEQLRTMLRRAVVAAAVTCTRAGADPPDAAELDRAVTAFG